MSNNLFNFGKNQGRSVAEVSTGYLKWFVANIPYDEQRETIDAIHLELKARKLIVDAERNLPRLAKTNSERKSGAARQACTKGGTDHAA